MFACNESAYLFMRFFLLYSLGKAFCKSSKSHLLSSSSFLLSLFYSSLFTFHMSSSLNSPISSYISFLPHPQAVKLNYVRFEDAFCFPFRPLEDLRMRSWNGYHFQSFFLFFLSFKLLDWLHVQHRPWNSLFGVCLPCGRLSTASNRHMHMHMHMHPAFAKSFVRYRSLELTAAVFGGTFGFLRIGLGLDWTLACCFSFSSLFFIAWIWIPPSRVHCSHSLCPGVMSYKGWFRLAHTFWRSYSLTFAFSCTGLD